MADAETLEAAPEAQIQTAAPDVEARARAQGWRPREEFRGDAARWRPADEFLRASETFMPVALERNRTLERKLDSADRKIEELTRTMTEQVEFSRKGEERAYARARSELIAKRDVAVAHADTETFKQVDREITELDKSASPKAEARASPLPKPTEDPDLTAWVRDNPWFNRDPELKGVAIGLDTAYMQSRPGLDTADRLALVKSEIMRRFSDKFENPNREAATSVSASSSGPRPRAAKHSYENLPPEAKKACDKFVKQIPGFKVEDYVRDFDWDS